METKAGPCATGCLDPPLAPVVAIRYATRRAHSTGTPLEAGLDATGDRRSSGDRLSRVEAHISLGSEGESRRVEGTYDADSDVFTFALDHTTLGGAMTRSDRMTWDAEGQASTATATDLLLGGGRTLGITEETTREGEGQEVRLGAEDALTTGLDLSLTAGRGTLAGLAAHADYGRGALKADLDLLMNDDSSSLAVGAEVAREDGWHGRGDLTLNLSEERIQEMSARLGWRDAEQFRSFALGYKAEWVAGNPEMAHRFDATFEYALGRVSARLSGNLELSATTVEGGRVDLLAGYRLDRDWMLLGGVGYAGERLTDTHSLAGAATVRTGVQYKRVGLTVGYTPERGAWSLGIVIPLGR